MEGEIRSAGSTEIRETDIVFECPKCGKSLAIDERGAGLIVRCPQCQEDIQVPVPAEGAEGEGEAAQEAPAETENVLESLQAEIARLNHRLSVESERHKRISAELGLIQAALDRIVDILAEPPSEPPQA
ncbi:MAG: zinc-ribbon domain-containing protein [Kiritimatiellae bacterium]|nr:zinc-ribbon domain-containing protein [Kiritimatiellia bacterium]MDW8458823.1 hypothetical protein [Verrucomicrobiota bacterium]